MIKKAFLPIGMIFAALIVLAAGAYVIVVYDPLNKWFPLQHSHGHSHGDHSDCDRDH